MRSLLVLTDVSNTIWYLLRSYSKHFSVILFALSLIMISVVSLFECIRRSSSLPLEEINSIVIVGWIFHVSNFLWGYICLVSMV